MWCFFDESYPPGGEVTAVVACLMADDTVRTLDAIMFQARKRAYGRHHAKNRTSELKGSMLLSKNSFRMKAKYGYSQNHQIADEILDRCYAVRAIHPIQFFGIAVYDAQDLLKTMGSGRLIRPLRNMFDKISACALSYKKRVNLVFDEQFGVRTDLAICTQRFIAGAKLKNVSHYPLGAVSNVSPGIQLADIGAYILGRHALDDGELEAWYEKLRRLEWVAQVDGHNKHGIQRYEKSSDGKYKGCALRKKKELGSAGKAPLEAGQAPLQLQCPDSICTDDAMQGDNSSQHQKLTKNHAK